MSEAASLSMGAMAPADSETSAHSASAVGVSIKGLYKVFGPHPKSCLPLVMEGMGKAQLLEQTGHVLGAIRPAVGRRVTIDQAVPVPTPRQNRCAGSWPGPRASCFLPRGASHHSPPP